MSRASVRSLVLLLLLVTGLQAQQAPGVQYGVGPVLGVSITGVQFQVEAPLPGGWTVLATVPVLWPSARDPIAGFQDRSDVWCIPQLGAGWRSPEWNALSAATELSTGVELAWLDEGVVDPTYGIDAQYAHAAASWKNEFHVRLDWFPLGRWGVEAHLSINLASLNRSRLAVLAVWAPRTD